MIVFGLFLIGISTPGTASGTSDSIISVVPSSSQIIPGQTFTLTIPITPAVPMNGAQLNLLYDSSLARVNSVTEGNFLDQDGANTLFNSGTINNSTGTVTNVYGSILGNTNVSLPGVFASVTMTAGSTTGYLNLNLTKVIISDFNSTAAPYTITNASVLVDTAPVLGLIGAKSIDEENAIAFTISASDVDGDSLVYAASSIPAGASFNTASGAFSWTPADGQAGTYVVTFTVTDGFLSDSEVVTISVNAVNHAPVMGSIGARSIDEEVVLTFTISASDEDGDRLVYSATNLPDGASIDAVTGAFSWTPGDGQAGTYVVTFEVSDGVFGDSQAVTITVYEVNHPPVITVFEPADASVFDELSTVNINVTANDVDGHVLTYVIKIDGVTCSTNPNYTWETGYSSSGIHIIDITVSDGTNQVTHLHTITINDVHPRWDVNEDRIVNILDVTIIGQKYGASIEKPYPRWDVNQDGTINVQDLTITAFYFGDTVG
ncbi:MAG: putative Ig domain-containing protein [ANME-2 cluster archaeon]|nr:putative Ig domain-containing protein [ANME-2 cluster archaeon]